MFKRYGGQFGQSGEGSNLKISLIGVYVFLAFGIVGLLTFEMFFVLIGFLFLVGFLVLSVFIPGGENEISNEDMQLRIIQRAVKSFNNKDIEQSYRFFKQAEQYGPIPENYSYLHGKVARKEKNA